MQSALFLMTVLSLGQVGSTNRVLPSNSVAELKHCVVMLIDHVQLPAQQTGVLRELIAKDGMIVKKDDLLGRIDDQDALLRKKAAEHKLEVARQRASNKSEVEAAKKIIEVALAEYEESRAINKRSPGSIPDTQMRRQYLQWERSVLEAVVAEMNIDIAKLEMQVSEAELEAVQNELRRIQITAPFDGVVAQLYKQQSEWVQPGEPVVRLHRMDRLRVEGFLSAANYAPQDVLGADVTITVTMAGGRKEKFKGKIDYVSSQIEASGDYRIWAEVDNRPALGYPWVLRPGDEAEMLIDLKSVSAAGNR
jgi:multidrug efflux pump subunit AcrA (membrane-fusion protein)